MCWKFCKKASSDTGGERSATARQHYKKKGPYAKVHSHQCDQQANLHYEFAFVLFRAEQLHPSPHNADLWRVGQNATRCRKKAIQQYLFKLKQDFESILKGFWNQAFVRCNWYKSLYKGISDTASALEPLEYITACERYPEFIIPFSILTATWTESPAWLIP